MKRIFALASSLLCLGVFAAVAEPEGAARSASPRESQASFEKHCTQCHPARKSMIAKKARSEWTETVGRMAARRSRVFEVGISLRDQERIADYLARNAGPSRAI